MTIEPLRILVVDDERSIRRLLTTSLSAHGFTVLEAANGTEALLAVTEHRPDVILLDLGLPDIDGVEVTRRLREWTSTPIIILSVREQETDKVAALDAGADDYMSKPFGIGELLARIRVSMRHIQTDEREPVFQLGDLTLDFTLRKVRSGEQEIQLTPTEYELLRVLVQSAGKVMTHRQLLHKVWGSGYEAENHLLRVNISNLRRKIETDPTQPRYLLTEAGVGYRINSQLLRS
ncbi:MAG: response regulator [Anaerolineaceae bacterium]|nr:response regulator [Anaerolineaceae bacterium]